MFFGLDSCSLVFILLNYLLNAVAISTAIAQQAGLSLSFYCTYHGVVTFVEREGEKQN